MKNNKGYEVEKAMKKWFHGESHWSDSVDFQTKTGLFEVKSCKLKLQCGNGNYRRPTPQKKAKTTQYGRFVVKLHNHLGIKTISEKENKEPKYIFVIVIENQKAWKVVSWADVDKLISREKESNMIRIQDVFKGVL